MSVWNSLRSWRVGGWHGWRGRGGSDNRDRLFKQGGVGDQDFEVVFLQRGIAQVHVDDRAFFVGDFNVVTAPEGAIHKDEDARQHVADDVLQREAKREAG